MAGQLDCLDELNGHCPRSERVPEVTENPQFRFVWEWVPIGEVVQDKTRIAVREDCPRESVGQGAYEAAMVVQCLADLRMDDAHKARREFADASDQYSHVLSGGPHGTAVRLDKVLDQINDPKLKVSVVACCRCKDHLIRKCLRDEPHDEAALVEQLKETGTFAGEVMSVRVRFLRGIQPDEKHVEVGPEVRTEIGIHPRAWWVSGFVVEPRLEQQPAQATGERQAWL